ncbi:MAG: hypothetical protein E6Q68_05205 [Polynucleobacter sp.]|nr:MAG: hypothetical protein E6Q68_05205 [Polynucleobacter sp.]
MKEINYETRLELIKLLSKNLSMEQTYGMSLLPVLEKLAFNDSAVFIVNLDSAVEAIKNTEDKTTLFVGLSILSARVSYQYKISEMTELYSYIMGESPQEKEVVAVMRKYGNMFHHELGRFLDRGIRSGLSEETTVALMKVEKTFQELIDLYKKAAPKINT